MDPKANANLPSITFKINLSFYNDSYLFIKLIQLFKISDLQLQNERLILKIYDGGVL